MIPCVVATRGCVRLVHQIREEGRWPNISDLTLEWLDTDATGEPRWIHVDHWCLSAQAESDVRAGKDTAIVALKMLLDEGEVYK